ncbi:hypothetical protein BN961_02147 [Afipia felis]|uniref:Uncharacterized protein n=1 Tax=Afipia felis TaxID=1035 RepID=A0A090MSY4_AFIFE|nr:hypothetical protein [Afipia felis]CEG08729.1 hypothetical protein BN961_02147 [Afipia felis]
MSLTDEWIDQYPTIDAKKLHALGMVTFIWNACEYKLFELFHITTGLNPNMAWLLVHDLNSIAVADRLSAYLDHAFTDTSAIQQEIDLIKAALAAYDVCRQNRNQLTHFWLEHDLEKQEVRMMRQKGPALKLTSFSEGLSDVRRVADELIGLNNHLNEVVAYMRSAIAEGERLPLPCKVLAPELLWKPPHPTGKASQPRREPSVLRLTEDEWLAKYRKEGKPLPDLA